MENVEILTEELEKVDIKYLGLPIVMREALLEAMQKACRPIAKVSITKNCRENRGIEGAFDEACKVMKKNYFMLAEAEVNKDRIWSIELKIVNEI